MAARNEESARDRARRRARERQRQVIRRRRLLALIGGLILVLLVVLATAAFGGDSKTKKAEDQLKPLTAPPDSAAAAHGRGIRAIDNVLSYTPYVSRGTPNQKLVALTFDDGPAPDTPEFIRVLRQYHAPATFFVITEQLKDFGDATREAVRDGFEVGDHTVNHQMLATLGKADQEHEIIDGVKQMTAAGIPAPQLFRPPGNSFDDTTLGILRQQHLLMTLWDVDTNDYKLPGTPAIVQAGLDHPHARRRRPARPDAGRGAADHQGPAGQGLQARHGAGAGVLRPAAARPAAPRRSRRLAGSHVAR